MRRVLIALLAVLALPVPAHAARITYLQAKPGRIQQLRAELRAAHATGVTFLHLGIVAIDGTAPAKLRALRYAHADQRIRLLDHQGTPLLYEGHPERLWSGGFDGRGVGIAIVDSGIDGSHQDLETRLVANTKVVADPTEFFGQDFPVMPVEATCTGSTCDTDLTSGHGTHVAGIAAGDGTASGGFHNGIAPGANLFGYSVGDGDSIFWALHAFEDILADHGKHNIRVVNASWGPANTGSNRADLTDPVHQATRKLHDAGITVVFAAGNDGTASNGDRPAGASKCDAAGQGDCKMNVDSVAPWVISVAATHEDMDGGAAGQGLAIFSSRGDPQPETTLDGTRNTLYQPTLSAPGVDVHSARAKTGSASALCPASASNPADCAADPPQLQPYYLVLSGTSMAAPHVTGAVAVVQSAAKARLGRYLTPDEVKALLTRTATRLTRPDGIWDWPCGQLPGFDCGSGGAGFTGKPYEPWQAGAGMVDVAAAVRGLAHAKR